VTLFDWAETATATLPRHEVPAERKPIRDAVIFGRRQDGSTSAYLRRDWTEAEVGRLREMDAEGKSNTEMAEALKRTVGSVDAALDRYIRPRQRKNSNIVWNEANRDRLTHMYVELRMTPTEIGQEMRIDTPVIHNALHRYSIRRPTEGGKARPCLYCRKTFWSTHIGNRLCDPCKEREEFKCAMF
jgi:hypothetical protein